MKQRPPKRVRRIRIEDGSRWDWVQSPQPTQAVQASMEWRFFQCQGYEVAEGELPVRPLRTRFIPLAEHLDEKRLVSRVTYRLPSTHPRYTSMAVEVTQQYVRTTDSMLSSIHKKIGHSSFQIGARRMAVTQRMWRHWFQLVSGFYFLTIILIRIPVSNLFFFIQIRVLKRLKLFCVKSSRFSSKLRLLAPL